MLSNQPNNQRSTPRRMGLRLISGFVRMMCERTVLLLGLLLCVVIGLMGWNLSRLSTHLITSTALADAAHFSNALAEVRTLYTQIVVKPAQASGINVTHNYASEAGAIPLPATFSMELGKRIGQKGFGAQVRLYSDHPFPWRQDGGPKDDFEKQALSKLRADPTQPYYRFEPYKGRPSLRFATADLMRTSCVSCHNTHPDSPKTDWQVGDIRGVLEVIRPLDDVIDQTRAGLRESLLLVVAASILGLTGLGFMMSRLRKTSEATRLANVRLANANQQLESRTQDLQVKQSELTNALGSLDIQNEQLEATNQVVESTNESLRTYTKQLEDAGTAALNMMQDMEAARQQSESATRSKSEFLANMSHEIRTPMTAILGYAELLMDPSYNEEQCLDAVQTIQKNGEHLLTIINDILDLSKIEAGKMTVDLAKCFPHQVLAEVQAMMRIRAQEKGLRFEVQCHGPIPQTIQSDATRLRQVLINLIGNAIKFTETGSVHVTMKMEQVTIDAEPRLCFEVIDTGIGLTREQLCRLFKPFTQADTSTTRRFGGTGLGLTISKRFAEMLGGGITVSRLPDQGTRFVVEIATGSLEGVKMIEQPIEELVMTPTQNTSSEVQAPNQTQIKPLEGVRLLLAEDGMDNQRLITFHLEKAGAQVTLANNGQIAYEQAMSAMATGLVYDVILMDMQMPEMDGYEATTKLREQGYTRPIIALTAHAMAGDREKCLNAGCDDYATKPINKAILIATVRSHLTEQPSGTS